MSTLLRNSRSLYIPRNASLTANGPSGDVEFVYEPYDADRPPSPTETTSGLRPPSYDEAIGGGRVLSPGALNTSNRATIHGAPSSPTSAPPSTTREAFARRPSQSTNSTSSTERTGEVRVGWTPQLPGSSPGGNVLTTQGDRGLEMTWEQLAEERREQPATGPIEFTFSPLSYGTMLLVPPASAADSRPRYHITISPNCFNPFSYVTTIRSGASERDPVVAEFELGMEFQQGAVTVGNRKRAISGALQHIRSVSGVHVWMWQLPLSSPHKFYWTGKYPPLTCRTSATLPFKDSDRLAIFTAPANQTPPSGHFSSVTLKIFPAGMLYFDDILVSAMIMERKRLTPRLEFKAMVGGSTPVKYI